MPLISQSGKHAIIYNGEIYNYRELAARHGLEDALLARLQALDLLYDRDEKGEFIHAFTETFEDRFFFEVVQRDGYEGFGAVNASVRMAVQAQRREAAKLGARLVL